MTDSSTPGTPRVKRPNSKQPKLLCSEDQLQAIAGPMIAFTGYCMGITNTAEIPAIKTMPVSLDETKRVLAVMMSNKLGKVVLPGDLHSLVLEVVSHAGYCKMSLIHGKLPNAQGYNIFLQGEAAMPLISKVSRMVQHQYPENTSEENVSIVLDLVKDL